MRITQGSGPDAGKFSGERLSMPIHRTHAASEMGGTDVTEEFDSHALGSDADLDAYGMEPAAAPPTSEYATPESDLPVSGGSMTGSTGAGSAAIDDVAPPVEGMTQAEDEPDLRTPLRPEGLGLPIGLMEDIILRRAVVEGRTAMTQLAERLHVSVNVVDQLITTMRDRKLVEFDGMEGRAYVVAVTEAGRSYSADRSRECRYVGPMPVPLDLYTEVVKLQRPRLQLNQEMLERSFSDLVISDELLDMLGPAIHGAGAMFLYGPPGTGKSSVAERIVRAYEDWVLVPYCIEVDGQIISVFDPTIHEPVADQPAGLDRRWIACERPAVVTGGELQMGMLDLNLDPDTGVYLAPLQLKANNGVLVIDDFGRQAMSPDALLNRWIVPLDRNIDYLTLRGRKFSVPFELKVVLSTNLDPAKLGDEAFYRRIHNKIFIGAVNDEQFDWILARVAQAKEIDVEVAAAEHLRQMAKDKGDGELRAYLPGVVCSLAVSIARYENSAFVLDVTMVDKVLDLYFTKVATPAVTGPGAESEEAPAAQSAAAEAEDALPRPTAESAAVASVGSILSQARSSD